MTCEYCGQKLVEVDNPMRRELRHRRGEELNCPLYTMRTDEYVAERAKRLREAKES